MKYLQGILTLVGVGLLAAIVWKMTVLEKRLLALEERTAPVEQRLAGLEGRLKPLEQRVLALEGHLAPVEREGHAYVVVPTPMRWVDAKAHAEKMGGYLAVVTTEGENQFVIDLARSKNVHQAIWIGLSDEENEGQWKWVNGEPFDFSAWEKGEPNGGRGENYVNMGHVNPTKWNDASTWARHPFVVEFNSAKDFKDIQPK